MNKKNQNYLLILFTLGIILISGIYLYRRTSFFSMGNNHSMRQSMHGDNQSKLQKTSLANEDPLRIPPLLEPTHETKESVTYDVRTQMGETQIKKGEKTKTLGYNGHLLGPVIKIKKGQDVTIKTENTLNKNTSFHWHGLKTDDNADGSPHQLVAPNSSETISFKADQEASTLWFHPHPEGETASQVYQGLAGLMYVEDENSDNLSLPDIYGKDDIPLIVQDRYFDSNNQIDYEKSYRSDGTQGDTLMINGTINPYLDVTTRWMRYRLVNGSNATNFTFSLDSQVPFYQVASDGGFLNKATEKEELILSPGERAEILVDTTKSLDEDKLNLLVDDKIALKMNLKPDKKSKSIDITQKLNRIPDINKNDTQKLPRQTIDLKGMSHMVNINGEIFDMNKINMTKKLNSKEVWEVNNISNMMGGMIHPFHVHGVQFRVLSRNGEEPPLNESGWKDTILVNPDEQVEILVSFDKKGIFMYHCHILEHEEYGMMGQLEVI
ncbi:multicopper oxidase family protein [Vagococcus carniphilus]|uniref:multicopper oxidase family protein n=1 Tax=Vagococcus carniphilus TaxID=218144 RepID=UPI003BAC8D09